MNSMTPGRHVENASKSHRAIEIILAGSDSSVDEHPWWRVDLGGEHCLGRVKVTLRTSCCGKFNPVYFSFCFVVTFQMKPTEGSLKKTNTVPRLH